MARAPTTVEPLVLKCVVVALTISRFVLDALTAKIFVKVAFVIEARLEFKLAIVPVATVMVAIVVVPVKIEVPVAYRFVVAKLDVVAFVPVAFVNNRLMIVVVIEFNTAAKKLVEVELETEALETKRFVTVAKLVVENDVEALKEARFVVVELVIVEFPVNTPSKEMVLA
jgi:hypothetical protein